MKRAIATLTVASCLSACTNFQDPTTVIDLRILAVTAEPSEIILDADISNPAMPVAGNNPPVTVTPLIVDPAGGGREVTYTISACPNNPFAPAPPGGGQGGGAFPSGGARTTVGSALCDEASPTTWMMTPQPVPAGMPFMITPTIEQLTIAFMTDIFPDQYGNLHGGFDLGMPLTLDIKVDAGTEQIRGVKRVLYWAQRIDAAQMPNQLPMIDSLDGFYLRDENTLDAIDPQPIGDDPMSPFTVTAGQRSIWIRPSPGIAESYETTVIDPDTHGAVPFTVARETLRYRFFATAGSFSPASTSTEPGLGRVLTGPPHIESEYRLPGADQIATEPDGTALITIWVVVRDDRGGDTWVTRRLRITP